MGELDGFAAFIVHFARPSPLISLIAAGVTLLVCIAALVLLYSAVKQIVQIPLRVYRAFQKINRCFCMEELNSPQPQPQPQQEEQQQQSEHVQTALVRSGILCILFRILRAVSDEWEMWQARAELPEPDDVVVNSTEVKVEAAPPQQQPQPQRLVPEQVPVQQAPTQEQLCVMMSAMAHNISMLRKSLNDIEQRTRRAATAEPPQPPAATVGNDTTSDAVRPGAVDDDLPALVSIDKTAGDVCYEQKEDIAPIDPVITHRRAVFSNGQERPTLDRALLRRFITVDMAKSTPCECVGCNTCEEK